MRMNDKPNIPDAIYFGKKEYSWRVDWKVNRWLFTAALISGAMDFVFPHVVRQWPVGWRAGAALIPLSAILLWVRDLARWIRGMDELHQRITLTAVLFSVSATFFFAMLWHCLDKAGV